MKKVFAFIDKHSWFLSALCFSLLLRIILFPLPPFKIDNDAWIAWSLKLADQGFGAFYEPGYFSDYLPGYLYVLSFFGYIQNIFSIPIESYALLLKFPPIAADIILGTLIYWIIMTTTKNIKQALLAALLFLFNPMVIFNSTIWGQADSILALGIVLTTFFLSQKKYLLASILAALSFLIKPQSIILGSVFIVALIHKFSLKKSARLILPALITLILLSLPFFSNPVSGLVEKFFSTAGQYSYTSLFAYNFWGIIGFWIEDNTKFLFFSYQQWGILFFTVFFISTLILTFKKKSSLWIFITLIALAFFFLPTKVHERYIYPAIPLLLIVAAIKNSYRLFYLTTLLSFINALNLYYVYVYYNENYLNLPKTLYYEPLYIMLESNGKLLSLFSTLIFIIIVWIIIKSTYVQTDRKA